MASKKFKIKDTDLVDYKRKRLARSTITGMLKRGELVRADTCELCHVKEKTEAHHLDYGQPTKVMWLCDKCHGKAHRADHHLNPKNIPQTVIPLVWDQKDFVTVSFHVPVENFILLKKLAEQKKTNVSKLVRGCVLEKYAVEDNQLEFNLFEDKKDESDSESPKRISLLEYNQERLHQQESQEVWPLWVEGIELVKRMGRFSGIHHRHGTHAAPLRWTAVAR